MIIVMDDPEGEPVTVTRHGRLRTRRAMFKWRRLLFKRQRRIGGDIFADVGRYHVNGYRQLFGHERV